MYNLIFFIIIIISIYYIYNYPKYKENFSDNSISINNINQDQIIVIQYLSRYLTDIKKLSDLVNNLINGSITVPNGLFIKGDLIVNGNSTIIKDSSIKGNLDVTGKSIINGINNINNITINNDANFESVAGFKDITTNDISLSNTLQIGSTTLNENTLYDLQNTQTGNINNINDNWKTISISFSKPFKNPPKVLLALTYTTGQQEDNNGFGYGFSQKKSEVEMRTDFGVIPIPMTVLYNTFNINTNGFTCTVRAKSGRYGQSCNISWIALAGV